MLLVASLAMAVPTAASGQVEEVDPSIGGVGLLLEPCRPAVHRPFSMVRVYPIRRDLLDGRVSSYPLSIISHRLGELFSLMPVAGDGAGTWQPRTTTDRERLAPHHYSVQLEEPGVRLEFTPAERAGHYRITPEQGRAVTLQLGVRHQGGWSVRSDGCVVGEETFHGMKAYVFGEFSRKARCATSGAPGKGRLSASFEAGPAVEFRYGLSFIGVEQAERNLRSELPRWDFDATVEAGRRAWNGALGKIRVEGGTAAQRRVFHTSLYRSHERMVNITEDGKYYSAYDGKVHEDARPFYVDNWIWDTYEALEPLHTILDPVREADKIASYVRMYEQSGWMPSFAVLYGDHPCMTGNHAAAWIADAWFKGVRNFDLARAYEGLRKNALEGTLIPWRNGAATSLDAFHAKNGYFPALRPDEKETVPEVHAFERRQAVAVTLEHAFDDWCLAQLARELGKKEDEALLLRRAANYRNVFRAEKGFMWPKDSEGKWIEPFDPKFSGGQGGRAYFTENNAYTYDWHARHDLKGLFTLMGGLKGAEAKLDRLFDEPLGRSKYEFFATFPDSTGMIGQFSMGNEPSFAIPYLYNYVGAPWKTQKRIRQLLETWFTDTLHGIPGDEDGGGMTAFVVLSMVGFYPVNSAVPVYTIGSPVFTRATIELPEGRRFVVSAPGASRENKYVQSVRLNGKPLERLWFRHAELMAGGVLELEMGPAPRRDLGTRPADLPPSSIDLEPARYVR